MSVAVPTILTHEHTRTGTSTTAGTSNDLPPTTHPSSSSASSMSSYSIIPPSSTVMDAPKLGSSHSEIEPHFPGAWVDTAPGTPAPLKDNHDNFAQQMKNANLTETTREELPPASGTQVASKLTKSTDPSLLPANHDDERELVAPVHPLKENPAEPASTTKVNLIGPVNTASEPLPPSAPGQPPRSSVNQPSSNYATEVQDNSQPLEQVIGSTLSPDEDVQEGAKRAGRKVPDSYAVPVVPIIATLGEHEHPTNANPQPNHPVSSNAAVQPNNVHPDVNSSPRTSRTPATQQKVDELNTVVPVNATREKATSGALSTTQAPSTASSKSTSSPDRIKSNSSGVPHSAYPLVPPSDGESLDKLSTCAVGGDTSVTSLSTSVGNGGSETNSCKKLVVGTEHSPRPIFSEEHDRALGIRRGRDAAPAADAIAGGATAGVAAKRRGEKEGTHFQRSTSPGTTKSSHFSGTRKLTKGARRSLSGGRTVDTGVGHPLTDTPAGAAFPESTYVIEGGVGAPQDLSKDPRLAPLPTSRGDSGIVEPTTIPAFAAGSSEHKPHKLTKKHSPTADAPPRVSESSIRPSHENGGTLTGLRSDVDTKGAPETERPILGNGSAHKPKLMDRIKGEVKILHGTLKGDEGKKMEGRMLKEFGTF